MVATLIPIHNWYYGVVIVNFEEGTFQEMENFTQVIQYIRKKRDENYSIFWCLENLGWFEHTLDCSWKEDKVKLTEAVAKSFRIPPKVSLEKWYIEKTFKEWKEKYEGK